MSEDTLDDIKSTNMLAAHVMDVQPSHDEIDTNSAFVFHADQIAPNHLGVPPVPELAGRKDQTHDFGDLRSPALARQREKSAKEKYYGFRYIKRGDVYPESAVEGGLSCHSSIEAREGKADGRDEQDSYSHSHSDENENENDEGDALSICDLCTTDSTKSSSPNGTTEIKQVRRPCKHTLYKMA